MAQKHDFFLEALVNNATPDQMIVHGITTDNSALQDKEKYEQNEYVQKAFVDENGQFDQKKFDAAYSNAQQAYNSLSKTSYTQALANSGVYSAENWLVSPAQRLPDTPMVEYVKVSNPYEVTTGIAGYGRQGTPSKSVDELAQSHKVLKNPTTAGDNLENAVWEDTPNGHLGKYFWDTLVLAQWDNDGTHVDPITGATVEHKKGDPKVNNDGQFYYEQLDGRDIYGKQVLNKGNILTVDGSWANKFDFFDSDDVDQKNGVGSLMRNAALVGSMFLPFGIGWAITGVTLATKFVGLAGTLGKMIAGSDHPTLSAMEGFSKSWSRENSTQYASEHPWCLESMLNMVGDFVEFGRTYRLMFEKTPMLFNGFKDVLSKEGSEKVLAELTAKQAQINKAKFFDLTKAAEKDKQLYEDLNALNSHAIIAAQASQTLNDIAKTSQTIGKVISNGYMALDMAGNTYGAAKSAGATDMEATLLTLGHSAALYGFMNLRLSQWILPELRAESYEYKGITRALSNIRKDSAASTYESLVGGDALTQKAAKQKWIYRVFNEGRNLASDVLTGNRATGAKTVGATIASGLGMGIEGTGFQVLSDLTNGCYNVANWLRGDDRRMDSIGYDAATKDWDISRTLSQYTQSFLSGTFGGAITNIFTTYGTIKKYDNMTESEARQKLIWMVRNGQHKKFLDSVEQMTLGNKDLSAIKFTGEAGHEVYASGTEKDNQDRAQKDAIRRQVQYFEDFLEAEGANISDNSILRSQLGEGVLKDLRFQCLLNATTAGGFIDDFNKSVTKLEELIAARNQKINDMLDKNGDGETTDRERRTANLTPEQQESLKSLNEQIDRQRQLVQDTIEGKNRGEFIAQTLFEMIPAISDELIPVTFQGYAEQVTGKKYDDLTEEELKKLSGDYTVWKVGPGRDRIRIASQVYRNIAKSLKTIIETHQDEYDKNSLLYEFHNIVNTVYGTAGDHPLSLEGEDLVQESPALLGDALQEVVGKWLNKAPNAEDVERTWDIMQKAWDMLQEIRSKRSEGEEVSEEEQKAQQAYDEAKENYKIEELKAINSQYKALIDEVKEAKWLSSADNYTIQSMISLITHYYDELRDLHIKKVNKAYEEIGRIQKELNNAQTEDEKRELSEQFEKAKDKADNINNEIGELDYELTNKDGIFLFDENGSLEINPEQFNIDNDAETPFEAFFSETFRTVHGKSMRLRNFFDMLSSRFYQLSDTSQYSMEDEEYGELISVINTLKLIRASVVGARTNINGQDGDYWGYNKTLNDIFGNHELAEISPETADRMVAEIESTLSHLIFYRKLFEANTNSKFSTQERVAARYGAITYQALNTLLTSPKTPVDKWNGYDALKNALAACTHLQSADPDTVPTASDREAMQKEQIQLEDALYNFFHQNEDKWKTKDHKVNVQAVKSIISLLGLENPPTELLTTRTKSLDHNALVWHLASRIAVKSSQFHRIVADSIKEDAEKAPLAAQELGAYLGYAWQSDNGAIFKLFVDAYRAAVLDKWHTMDEKGRKDWLQKVSPTTIPDKVLNKLVAGDYEQYIINHLIVPRYTNFIYLEGVAGAGKTEIDRNTLTFLAGGPGKKALNNPIVVHGGLKSSALALKANLGIEKGEAYDKEEFMNYITSKRWIPTLDKDGNVQTKRLEYEVKSESGIPISKITHVNTDIVIGKELVNMPSIILIDEVSQFSLDDLDLIHKYAEDRGIMVLLTGDLDQLSTQGSIENTHIKGVVEDLTQERGQFIRAPKLGVSMRSDNALKTGNLTAMEVKMRNPESQVTLSYYKSKEEGLFGDKVMYTTTSADKTELRKQLLDEIKDLISTLKGDEKIGLVYQDNSQLLYDIVTKEKVNGRDLSSYFILYPAKSSLGLEGRYHLVEADANNQSQKDYLQTIYTGMSRSSQGSIILLHPLSDKQNEITSKKVSNKVGSKLSPEAIKQYAKNRKAVLNRVLDEIKQNAATNVTNTSPAGQPSQAATPPANQSTPDPQKPLSSTAPQSPDPVVASPVNLPEVVQPQAPEEPSSKVLDDAVDNLKKGLGAIPILPEHTRKSIEQAIGDAESESDPQERKRKISAAATLLEKAYDPQNTAVDQGNADALIVSTSNEEMEQAVTPVKDKYDDQIQQINTPETSPVTLLQNPEVSPNTDGKEGLLFYTHASLKDGLPRDRQGNVDYSTLKDHWSIYRSRIDGIWGFFNKAFPVTLDNDGKPDWEKDWDDYHEGSQKWIANSRKDVLQRIAHIQSIIMSSADKGKALERLRWLKNQGFPIGDIRFALKNTSTDKDGKEFASSTCKEGISETCYSNTDVKGSDQLVRRQLVAILIDTNTDPEKGGRDIMEIPLGCFNSPITLLQVKEGDNYKYGDASAEFNERRNGGGHIPAILESMYKKGMFSKYPTLEALVRAYINTDNVIVFIDDQSWYPNADNGFDNRGTYFADHRGDYQVNQQYQGFWHPVEKDPRYIISPVLVSVDLTGLKRPVQQGHPFILISFNKSLTSNKDKWDAYQSGDKNVVLHYVSTPTGTWEDFIADLHNRIRHTSETKKPIGYVSTSFNILYSLWSNTGTKEELKKAFIHGFHSHTGVSDDKFNKGQQIWEALDELFKYIEREYGNESDHRKLFTFLMSDWSTTLMPQQYINDGTYKVYQFLNSVLEGFMYDEKGFQLSQTNHDTLAALMEEVPDFKDIKYSIGIVPKDKADSGIDNVLLANTDNRTSGDEADMYKLGGKSLQVYGKLDPPVYMVSGMEGLLNEMGDAKWNDKQTTYGTHHSGWVRTPEPVVTQADVQQNIVKVNRDKAEELVSKKISGLTISPDDTIADMANNVNGTQEHYHAEVIDGKLYLYHTDSPTSDLTFTVDPNTKQLTAVKKEVVTSDKAGTLRKITAILAKDNDKLLNHLRQDTVKNTLDLIADDMDVTSDQVLLAAIDNESPPEGANEEDFNRLKDLLKQYLTGEETVCSTMDISPIII